MTTRLLFRTQFHEGARDRVVAVCGRALPGLRSLACVKNVTVHDDRNDQDVVWAVWEFATADDMLMLYEEPLYQQFLAELRPLVAERGVQTHVLTEVTEP